MQRVDLFRDLADNTRQQRHTGTWALLGSAHPIKSGRGGGGVGDTAACLTLTKECYVNVCECVISPQEFNFSNQADDEQH